MGCKIACKKDAIYHHTFGCSWNKTGFNKHCQSESAWLLHASGPCICEVWFSWVMVLTIHIRPKTFGIPRSKGRLSRITSECVCRGWQKSSFRNGRMPGVWACSWYQLFRLPVFPDQRPAGTWFESKERALDGPLSVLSRCVLQRNLMGIRTGDKLVYHQQLGISQCNFHLRIFGIQEMTKWTVSQTYWTTSSWTMAIPKVLFG